MNMDLYDRLNLSVIPTIPLNKTNDCGFCYTIILNDNYAVKANDYILRSKYHDSENDKIRCLEPFKRIELYSRIGKLSCVVNHLEMKYEYQSDEGTIKFSDLFTLPSWYLLKGGKIKLYRTKEQYEVEDLCVFANSCIPSPMVGPYDTRDIIKSAERQNTFELNGEIIDFRCFRQNQNSKHNEFWYKSIPVKNCMVNGEKKDWKNMYIMKMYIEHSYIEQLYFEIDDEIENIEKYKLYIVLKV